jgi:hypothetical protein
MPLGPTPGIGKIRRELSPEPYKGEYKVIVPMIMDMEVGGYILVARVYEKGVKNYFKEKMPGSNPGRDRWRCKKRDSVKLAMNDLDELEIWVQKRGFVENDERFAQYIRNNKR